MIDDNSELTTIMQRVEKLEKQNRRMKQIGITLIMVAASLLSMGQKSAVQRTVEANEFVLIDGNGHRRAALGSYGKAGDPSFSLLDEKGAVRMLLLLDKHDPSLSLYNGRSSILALGYGGRGTSPFQAMAGSMAGDGPYIMMADKEGFQAVIGSAAFEAARTGETRQTSAASVILFGKDKILWKAP
jgi:hypothetical protein